MIFEHYRQQSVTIPAKVLVSSVNSESNEHISHMWNFTIHLSGSTLELSNNTYKLTDSIHHHFT